MNKHTLSPENSPTDLSQPKLVLVSSLDPQSDLEMVEAQRIRSQRKKAAVSTPLPKPEEEPRISADKLRQCILTSAGLNTMEIPKRSYLLGEWLCVGDLGYIFAPRGVGKTWLAMSVPQAISSGQPLGEWSAGEHKAKVLYVDGEMPIELTRARNRSLSQSGEGVDYLHHDRIFELLEASVNIALHLHQEAITEILVGGGYDCLVLDNLSCLASGLDENKGQDHEAISNWLLNLRRRKITVIFIHHAGRGGEMRGHSKREDACSWILQLRDAKEEGDDGAKFISHFAKPSRNTSKALPDLLWHFQTAPDQKTEITCTVAEVEDYERFIQHVQDGVDCAKDIAELMDKPKGTVSKWKKKAVDSGRIICTGNSLKPSAV